MQKYAQLKDAEIFNYTKIVELETIPDLLFVKLGIACTIFGTVVL